MKHSKGIYLSTIDKIWQETWIQACLRSRSFWLTELCLSTVLGMSVKTLLYGEKPWTNKCNVPQSLLSNCVICSEISVCHRPETSAKSISVYSWVYETLILKLLKNSGTFVLIVCPMLNDEEYSVVVLLSCAVNLTSSTQRLKRWKMETNANCSGEKKRAGRKIKIFVAFIQQTLICSFH